MNTEKNFNEEDYQHLKGVLPLEDYEKFISFKKREAEFEDYKANQRSEGRKKEAGQDFFTKRDSLIVRRAKVQGLDQDLAPDEDVLAFNDIHKLKKAKEEEAGTYQERMKIHVSDEEIEAFRKLEGEGYYFKDITLDMIERQLKEETTESPISDIEQQVC